MNGHFDESCKVTIFNGYYDTTVAVIAYFGGMAYAYPISSTGPPVYGVDQVSSSDAKQVIEKFFQQGPMVLADNVTVFMPGEQAKFGFSGVFTNRTQFLNALVSFTSMFEILGTNQTADLMVQNGRVAAFLEYSLKSVRTGREILLPVCEHFLINGQKQIQQYALFFDTWFLLQIM